MKNEFHGKRSRWIGFAGRPLMTLVLMLGLIAAVPFLSKAAEAENFDSSKTCSLTVTAAKDEEMKTQLAEANLVIDLYKVADALANENNDGYTYQLLSAYKGLGIDADMTGEKWRELSQKAAGIALDVNTGGSKLTPSKSGVPISNTIDGLDAGLYLLIARSEGIDKYVTTNTDKEIVTRANSGEYAFTFLPELVSMPTKEPDEDGVINTAAPGEWLYDLTVVLKPAMDVRDGSFKIIKRLLNYNASAGPATFVFDVEAVLDGKKVYSNVVSIVFDAKGTQELIIDKIPIGAEVTVTEVYSGACYKLVTDGKKMITLEADTDIPSVEFINDYDERQNGGHGITNHFTYEPDGWKWTQIFDKSQG